MRNTILLLAMSLLSACDDAPRMSVPSFGELRVEGDTLVVGGDSDDRQAVVAKRDEDDWVEQTTLTADGPGDFGAAVALSASTLAVAQPVVDTDASESELIGSVHVYVASGDSWQEEAELSEGAAGDDFGASIDLDGDTLVVGAPHFCRDGFAGIGCGVGAVYVFARTAGRWELEATLRPPADEMERFDFGSHVALSGDVLAVVSFDVVDVFERTPGAEPWTHRQAIKADNPGIGLAGDRLAIVGPFFGPHTIQFLDRANGSFTQSQEIVLSEETLEGTVVQHDVAFSGDVLVVSLLTTLSVYRRDDDGNWSETAELTGEEPPSDIVSFAGPVAVDGSTIVAARNRHIDTFDVDDIQGGCSIAVPRRSAEWWRLAPIALALGWVSRRRGRTSRPQLGPRRWAHVGKPTAVQG